MTTYQDRIISLNFGLGGKLPSKSLMMWAKAGFYFVKMPDILQCYYCALTIEVFQTQKMPFFIHALKNETCEFLLKEKGVLWIQRVKHTSMQDIPRKDKKELSKQRVSHINNRIRMLVLKNKEAKPKQGTKSCIQTDI